MNNKNKTKRMIVQPNSRNKQTGPDFIIKTIFLCIWIPVANIRRMWDRLMFVMRTPLLLREHLYIQMPPSSQLIVFVAVMYRLMFPYSPRRFHWQWISNCISSVWCWCNHLIAVVVSDSFISNRLVYLYFGWKGVRFALSYICIIHI